MTIANQDDVSYRKAAAHYAEVSDLAQHQARKQVLS
jgi:hypothetical protein